MGADTSIAISVEMRLGFFIIQSFKGVEGLRQSLQRC